VAFDPPARKLLAPKRCAGAPASAPRALLLLLLFAPPMIDLAT